MKPTRKKIALFILPVSFLFIGFALPTTSYATPQDPHQLVHAPSGKCAVPKGRKEAIGTKIVLHKKDCGLVGRYNAGAGKDDATALNFTFDEHRKRIIHDDTGLCLVPQQVEVNQQPKENTRVALGRCTSNYAEHRLSRGKYLQHVGGLCIHIRVSYGYNLLDGQDGAELIYKNGCLGERIAWKFVRPTESNESHADTKFIHSFSGLCAEPQNHRTNNNTTIVLTEHNCNVESSMLNFEWLENGAILHKISGKCIHPHGGRITPYNNTRLVLHEDCTKATVRFEMLENGAIKHATGGYCIRPSGHSRLQPHEGTRLELHEKCDAGRELAFEFLEDE